MKIVLTLIVVYFTNAVQTYRHGMLGSGRHSVFGVERQGMLGGERHRMPGGEGRDSINSIPRLRTHPRGRKGGHFKRRAGVNIWLRHVTDGVTVMEKAFVKRTSQAIFLKSIDRKLEQAEIQPSVSVHDFTNNFVAVRTPIGVLKVCLILPGFVAGDYATTARDTLERNKVFNTELVGEFIMTGDGPLTHTQVNFLNSTHPHMVTFCHRPYNRHQPVEIVDAATVVSDMTDLRDTRPISVMTIHGKVTIYIKKIH